MARIRGSDVSIQRLAIVAFGAAIAVAVAQFGLDLLVELARHGEIQFDSGDRLLGLLIGAISTAAIVAGAYWITTTGTEEWVVARAMAAVYVAAVLEVLLRSAVFEWVEFESWTVLTSLSTVLYFLAFVIAYRAAFEDRPLTDWDPSAVTGGR